MHQKPMFAALGIFVMLTMPTAALGAEISEDDYALVNTALVEEHVLPRYAVLAETTKNFAKSTKELCENPGESTLNSARQDFHRAMDAWMGVQHLRFGPIKYLMRIHRFYFWPEARGKIADAVRDYTASIDTISMKDFQKANVAVQGFLAAEVILFGNYELGIAGKDKNACKLLVIVSNNLEEMAIGTLSNWQEGDSPFMQFTASPGEQNPIFDSHKEVTLALFQSMHGNLQLISEVKLKPVVGKSIQAARPRLAESRLSGRALRNIILNLETQEELYNGVNGVGLGTLTESADPKLDKLMRKAFRATLKSARSIDPSLAEAATNEELRPQAEKLALQVQALTQIVRQRLTKALELAVGFNELDGD